MGDLIILCPKPCSIYRDFMPKMKALPLTAKKESELIKSALRQNVPRSQSGFQATGSTEVACFADG